MSITLRNPSNDPVPNRVFGDAPVAGISVIWHNGNDYGWGQGAQVYAAASGRVSSVRWASNTRTNNRGGGYGNYIIIDHPGGYSTLYGHLPNSAMFVRLGQQVTAGERIGTMGNTGNASGVHLHFELRLNGRIIDPNPHIGSSSVAGSTPIEILAPILKVDEMIRIQAPGRGIALIGPGYYRHLSTAEEVEQSEVLMTKHISGNDRQFDLWVSMASVGRGVQIDSAAITAAVVASLAPSDGDVDVEAIAAAVDAALADNFSEVPASVLAGLKNAL